MHLGSGVYSPAWGASASARDRAADLAGREALVREREALLARAREEKKNGGGNGEKVPAWNYLSEDGAHGCAAQEVGE